MWIAFFSVVYKWTPEHFMDKGFTLYRPLCPAVSDAESSCSSDDDPYFYPTVEATTKNVWKCGEPIKVSSQEIECFLSILLYTGVLSSTEDY